MPHPFLHLLHITIPKFTARAIRKVHDIGWKPTHLLNGVSVFGEVLG